MRRLFVGDHFQLDLDLRHPDPFIISSSIISISMIDITSSSGSSSSSGGSSSSSSSSSSIMIVIDTIRISIIIIIISRNSRTSIIIIIWLSEQLSKAYITNPWAPVKWIAGPHRVAIDGIKSRGETIRYCLPCETSDRMVKFI